MKILAMYLPQFHRVKENDEWWGEGFTEWVTVKNAKSLSENHVQPKVPLNENYYNLLDVDTLKWQAELMYSYGIDGMCMYHYWFKDGRQILERPAELLLENKDVQMPFCFCWANETWARSWSAVQSKNVWSYEGEKKQKNDKAVLLEQKYGGRNEWKTHFEYLLPFFKDDRYIKIDNKPVFLIYKSSYISRLEAMTDYWKELAVENGFDGIYFIGSYADNIIDGVLDEKMVHAPAVPISHILKGTEKYPLVINYEDVWNKLLSEKAEGNIVTYEGVVNYDDTPRRGEKGKFLTGATPALFEKYLSRLIVKNAEAGSRFTFINAWNEWGEGMYLEPDTITGMQYLQAVKHAKEKFAQKADKNIVSISNMPMKININKDSLYLKYMDKWMELRERGQSLETYFIENNIKMIAVYGYGVFAKHLIAELKNTSIQIECIYDKQWRGNIEGISGTECSEIKKNIEAVVVCSFYYFNEIHSILKEKGYGDIISLKAIIDEVY